VEQILDFVKTFIESVLGKSYRSSALSALLWLDSLVGLPCLVMSFCSNEVWKFTCFFSVAVAMIVFTVAAYIYLVRLDPKWVQSERFQIEHAKINQMAHRGGLPIDGTVPNIEVPGDLVKIVYRGGDR
jgi:hypothetical protein